jgi:toxin ParE1/3/4
MNYRVRRHVEVEADILDLATWIARDSHAIAHRFLQAVETTVNSLQSMPGKGSLKQLRDSRLVNVRSWAVNGFPNHLIFYQIRGNAIFILAVVHGARKYPSLLRSRTKLKRDE